MGNGGGKCRTGKLKREKWKRKNVERLLRSGNVSKNYLKRRNVMGRAIDMEKDIDVLKREMKELKDVLQEILKGVKDDKKETKKTNTKRSKASSGKSDTRPSDSE